MKNIRAIAIKTTINRLLKGIYIVKEGWDPNYIELNGEKISRVNIIGTIVGKEDEMFLIDDGTGTIPLRSFEEELKLEISKIYLLIGKVREYNEQRYIIPEIIKKIDKKWVELRKKELKEIKTEEIENKQEIQVIKKENTEKPKKTEKEKPLIELVQELDKGEGVNIEEINEKLGRNCDKELNKLVEEGELFSIKPGVLKVL